MIKRLLISAIIALQLMPQTLLAQQAAARSTQAQAQHTCIWVHPPCDECASFVRDLRTFCYCSSGEGVCVLCNAHSKLSAQEWGANIRIYGEDFQKIENEIAIHQEARKKIKHDPTLSYEKARAQAKAENHQRWMERIQQDTQQAQRNKQIGILDIVREGLFYYGMYKLGKAVITSLIEQIA